MNKETTEDKELSKLQLLSYLLESDLAFRFSRNRAEQVERDSQDSMTTEDYFSFGGAFVWSRTKEGHAFWFNESLKYSKLLDRAHLDFRMDSVAEEG